MFWGIILKPGQEYPQTLTIPIKITMAVIADGQQFDEVSKLEYSRVKLESNNQSFFICRLHPSNSPQVPLNLEFSAGSAIKFYVIGPFEVHLSGFTKEPVAYRRISTSEYHEPKRQPGFSQDFKTRILSESDDISQIPESTVSISNNDLIDTVTLREKPTSTGPSKGRKRASVSDSVLEAKFGKIMIQREEELLGPSELGVANTEHSRKANSVDSNSNSISEGSEAGNVFLDPSSSPDVSKMHTQKNSVLSDIDDVQCTFISRHNSQSTPSSPNPANSALLAKAVTIQNHTEEILSKKIQELPQATYPQTVLIATSPFHAVFSAPIGKPSIAMKSLTASTSTSLAESSYPIISSATAKAHSSPSSCTIAPHSGIPDNHPFLTLALDHCSRLEKRTENKTVIEDISFGQGKRAQKGQRVFVRYIGVVVQLKKVIDSNLTAKMPFSFRLGMGEVIHGWDAGLEDMRVGGTRKIVIPSNNIYGSKSFHPEIPPESDMIFIVKLVGLN